MMSSSFGTYAVFTLSTLVTGCQRERVKPPVHPSGSGVTAECTVVYLERERGSDWEENGCLAEMVYAEFYRRGFMVYRFWDAVSPEIQPRCDFVAYPHLEKRVPGPSRVELLISQDDATGRSRRIAAFAIELRGAGVPSGEVVSSLVDAVGAPMAEAARSVTRRCPNRDEVLRVREPHVSEACAHWGSTSDR
jgi:hypothetical protein